MNLQRGAEHQDADLGVPGLVVVGVRRMDFQRGVEDKRPDLGILARMVDLLMKCRYGAEYRGREFQGRMPQAEWAGC